MYKNKPFWIDKEWTHKYTLNILSTTANEMQQSYKMSSIQRAFFNVTFIESSALFTEFIQNFLVSGRFSRNFNKYKQKTFIDSVLSVINCIATIWSVINLKFKLQCLNANASPFVWVFYCSAGNHSVWSISSELFNHRKYESS